MSFESGLLEQPTLNISLARASTGDARFPMTDASGEHEIGHARLEAPNSFWLRLVARPVVRAHEAGDEPLLFTMIHGWGWTARWKVLDADERLVGTLRRQQIIDRHLMPVANLEWEEKGLRGVFRDPKGQVLASVERGATFCQLTFSGEDLQSPFVRMLLLASVLSQFSFSESSLAVDHVTA